MALAPLRVAWRPVSWALHAPQGRISRWLVIACVAFYGFIGWLVPVGDSLNYSAAQSASVGHHYGLLSFELENFLDKWAHRVYTALPWTETGTKDRKQALDRYLELVPLIRDAEFRVLQESSRNTVIQQDLNTRQIELDELLAERDALRDSVEEYLEAAISAQIREQDLNVFGGFIWPPVDFRIDNPPSVLVISPRDRIARAESVLIDPEIPAADMERIELALLEDHNLSAAIMRTGGLASYPNVISSTRDLLPMLQVATHEWIHAYLFFHTLGRSFFNGGSMVELNETLADLVGDEIGGMTWAALTGNEAPVADPPVYDADPEPIEPESDTGVFDFFRFMRETRLHTDDLLEQGKVDAAEEWMEQRRLELIEHGYYIRKINQAFFAFNGSYGSSPSSVSPTARQMWELRQQEDDAAGLLKALQGISSYPEFEALLDERGITVGR